MQGRALPAVLVQHPSRGPETHTDVSRRIARGRPAFAFSPDRSPRPATGRAAPVRLIPLTPQGAAAARAAVPELAKMPRIAAALQGQPIRSWIPVPRPRQGQIQIPLAGGSASPTGGAFGADGGTFESAALVAQAAVLLTAWGRAGGSIDPPDFGSLAGDLEADTTNPRFTRAVASFQRAWNGAHGPELAEDGQLDLPTYSALVQVGGKALAPHASAASPAPADPPAKTSSGGEWLLAVPIVVLVGLYLSKGGRS